MVGTALQLPQLITFADERVEVMADRLAVDSGVGGEVLRTADGEHVFERVDGVGSLISAAWASGRGWVSTR